MTDRQAGVPAKPEPVGLVAGLVLLTIRGLLLWFVAPMSFLAWLALSPWMRKRHVTAGQFVGWVDNNMTVFVQRGLLRPLFSRTTTQWIPARDLGRMTHRVRGNDLF